jgi:hypothetical protein
MKIPSGFDHDLRSAYRGELSLDQLIKNQETFLRKIARYSLRYRTAFMISDLDDMFQEACYWMINSMWEWDDTRGPSLSAYVMYNIGARLSGIVKCEKNIKRHPNPNASWKKDIWGSSNDECDYVLESTLPSTSDTEIAVAVKLAFEFANDHLSDLAKELTIALIECDGNFVDAVRLMAPRIHIKRRFGTEHTHLKYVLRTKVLPEISMYFNVNEILSEV